jgi:hypothetical protein
VSVLSQSLSATETVAEYYKIFQKVQREKQFFGAYFASRLLPLEQFWESNLKGGKLEVAVDWLSKFYGQVISLVQAEAKWTASLFGKELRVPYELAMCAASLFSLSLSVFASVFASASASVSIPTPRSYILDRFHRAFSPAIESAATTATALDTLCSLRSVSTHFFEELSAILFTAGPPQAQAQAQVQVSRVVPRAPVFRSTALHAFAGGSSGADAQSVLSVRSVSGAVRSD